MQDKTRRKFLEDVAQTGLAIVGGRDFKINHHLDSDLESGNSAQIAESTIGEDNISYMANLNRDKVFVSKTEYSPYKSETMTLPIYSTSWWEEDNCANSLVSEIKSQEIDVFSLNESQYQRIIERCEENPYCKKGINHEVGRYSQSLDDWMQTGW